MKNMIALLLALCMLLTLAACGTDGGQLQETPGSSQQEETPNENAAEETTPVSDLQTIYVLVSEAYYSVDGINYQNIRYDYDQRGFRTSMTIDNGGKAEVWDEETSTYQYVSYPVDGEIDTLYEHAYDENGYPTVQTGKALTSNSPLAQDASVEYVYEYDENGRPVYLSCTSTISPKSEYRFTYDDNGNVIKIEGGNSSFDLCMEYAYDEQGRLTYEWVRDYAMNYPEGYGLEYIYEDDRLVEIIGDYYSKDHWKLEYDSEGRLTAIRKLDDIPMDREFAYDENGFLCEYNNWYATNNAQTDPNGNVIRLTAADGSYIEYEYEERQVSAADAAHYDNCISADERYMIRPYPYHYGKMFNFCRFMIHDPIPNVLFYR